MSETIDKEIEAIKKLLLALEPLESHVRESVLGYVCKRLNIKVFIKTETGGSGEPQQDLKSKEQSSLLAGGKKIHIKNLKEEKKPKSAIEMAVLVAYYISHLAAEKDRRETLTTKDLETYFKIAGFKLPKEISFTLSNAKKAGYLDSAGKGKYELNPVGYNLVVHSLPRK